MDSHNTPRIYDVIIAGAGPSGSVCAYFLAQKGFSVLLLERFSFPREKLCAGGIAASAFRIIPVPFSPDYCVPVERYMFTYKGEKECSGDMPAESIYSVDRSFFDMKLAHTARDAGAELKENHRVIDIEEKEDLIKVTCENGKDYLGKFLVGADGGNSLISRKFGLNYGRKGKGDRGICGYYKFYTDGAGMERYKNTVHLDFNFLDKGVAGILPKKDYLWIGTYKTEKDVLLPLKKSTDEFIYNLGLSGTKSEFRGLLLPLYRKKRKLADNKMLLVGEAAGLVNPLSGEGIKPAMDSGKIAAEEIEKHLKEGKALNDYNNRIHKEIGEELLTAGKFLKIAYTFPQLAYDGMTHVAGDAVRILNGDLSYGNFMERLKKKILRKIGIGG